MKAIILTDIEDGVPGTIKALAVIRENAVADAAVTALNAVFTTGGATWTGIPAGLAGDEVRVKAVRCDSSVEPGATISADESIYHDVVPDP